MRREASRATPERARLYPIGGICKRLRSFSPLARLRKFEYKVASMTGFGAEIAAGMGPLDPGAIARMLIRIRQKARIFRLLGAEISAARPERGPHVTSARTGHATVAPSLGGSCR